MTMAKGPIIAVDGYSSSGKSTFAKAIAAELGIVYIDSGAMYRAVALYCIEKGIIYNQQLDEEKLRDSLDGIHITFSSGLDKGQRTMLNGTDVEDRIRGIEVAEIASRISQVPEVRRKMVSLQRSMAAKGGIVMDGRDIGTVVFPEAEMKIFMNADATVRAKRRYDELIQKGMQVSFDDVLANIRKRDHQDEHRTESPLKKAGDALVLDNSHMTIEEEMHWFRTTWRKLDDKRQD
jgi:cytidylate kinase